MSHGADLDAMSSSGRLLHSKRLDLAAMVLAVPALWIPGWWLFIALGIYFVLLVYRHIVSTVNPGSFGPATLIVLPFRALLGVLLAIPRVILAAIGVVLAMVASVIAIGIVTGLIGMAFGLLLYHDKGDLLLADFRATALSWGVQFGPFLAAYFVTKTVFKHSATDSKSRAWMAKRESIDTTEDGTTVEVQEGLVVTIVNQIGEMGLVGIVIGGFVLIVLFSTLAPSIWQPFGGYRGVAGTVHVRGPLESAIRSRIQSDTASALGSCNAEFVSFSQVQVDNGATTLKVLFSPSPGVSPIDAGALIAARITNRVIPTVDTTTIQSKDGAVQETLVSSQHRTTVFRTVPDAGQALSPPLRASTSFDPLLKHC